MIYKATCGKERKGKERKRKGKGKERKGKGKERVEGVKILPRPGASEL